MIHISMFVASFFVKNEETEGSCGGLEGSKELVYIQIVHLICFVLLSAESYLESYNPNFHLTEFFRIICVLMNQGLVLRI
jgi:hypothetical protein